MKAYKLDGTEPIKTVGYYGTPSVSNGVMQCGGGVLSNGFDNTGNWVIEADVMFGQQGNDIQIIPSNVTVRDDRCLQIFNSQIARHESSSSYGGNAYAQAVAIDTWHSFKLTKNGTTFTVEIGGQTASVTWNAQSSSSTLQIGVDRWQNNYCARLRNIRVKPL